MSTGSWDDPFRNFAAVCGSIAYATGLISWIYAAAGAPIPADPWKQLEYVAAVCGLIVAALLGWVAFRALLTQRQQGGREAPPEQQREVASRQRSRRDRDIGSALAFICAAIWSLSYVSLKYVCVRQASSQSRALPMTAVVFLVAALSLYAAQWVLRRWPDPSTFASLPSVTTPATPPPAPQSQPQAIAWGLGIGIVLVATNLGNFVCGILALKYISASEAMALSNTAPVFVAIFLALLGLRRFAVVDLFMVFLISAGIFVLVKDAVFERPETFPGLWLAIVSGVAFAGWTVAVARLEVRSGRWVSRFRALGHVFLASWVLLSAATTHLRAWGDWSQFNGADIVVLVLNGVRVAFVYALFSAAVQKAGPVLAAVFVVFTIPLTLVWDANWLHTQLTLGVVAGALFIMAGGLYYWTER